MKRILPKTERHFHIIGWTMFVLCSLVYITASLKAGDMISLFGGILFLFGCIFFLIPLLNDKAK